MRFVVKWLDENLEEVYARTYPTLRGAKREGTRVLNKTGARGVCIQSEFSGVLFYYAIKENVCTK